MGQYVMTLELDAPACPGSYHLPGGARVLCQAPGGCVGPYGLTGEEVPPGWKTIARTGGGNLVARPDLRCGSCPAADLPTGAYPLAVDLSSEGVRMRVACDREKAALVLESLARHRPRVRRAARDRTLDLRIPVDGITARQWEVLQAALELGYFRPGGKVGVRELAERCGCSHSTAHEHLRKALERLAKATTLSCSTEPAMATA